MTAMGAELARYQSRISGYDEAVDGGGLRSAGWEAFLNGVGEASAERRASWHEAIARDLRVDGLTFTVSQDASPLRPAERMDPVPWLLDADTWRTLEAGIAQRARLLEAVVRDLCGPRTLIARGRLPAEAVFTDPAYVRPAVGLPANMGAYLFQYAVDLARGPDGRMWVLEDRAESPAGAGYALESRTILGRVFPRGLSRLQVRRLSPYFRGYREAVMGMYEGRRLEPRAVLLTPGPYNANYFEHAYLAAYLGYTLVQGSDLLVRDGCLKLKTLEGLQPVDIVLRRVDADFLDPLELRRDSCLGVSGLLGAMRAGRVACANHPGCGILSNRALLPFLPGLCRELLGEEMLLPSAATWWCGQERECGHVLAHLDELVVKPVRRDGSEPAWFGGERSASEREAMREKIRAHPERWIAQERIGHSSAPCLPEDQLEPRAAVLRAFASASPDGYRVMPGGFARTAEARDAGKVSMRGGGMIKDVWVLGDAPEPHRSLWLQNQEERGNDWFTGVFTSRSAENLFWVGRYAERLMLQVRLLRAVLAARAESGMEAGEVGWLIGLLEAQCGAGKGKGAAGGRIRRLLTGEEGVAGVRKNLRALLVAAYTVRDIWSQDCWRTLTSIEQLGETCCEESRNLFSRGEVLEGLMGNLNAFYGLGLGGMTRESGWNMLMLGHALEAGIGLCGLVEGLIGGVAEEAGHARMEHLLALNENLVTYRRHYRTTPRLPAVLALVVASEINPRSLVFQLARAAEQIYALPPPADPTAMEPATTGLKRARSRLLAGEGGESEALCERLREARDAMERTSRAVSLAYFSHTAVRALEDF